MSNLILRRCNGESKVFDESVSEGGSGMWMDTSIRALKSPLLVHLYVLFDSETKFVFCFFFQA